MTFHALHEFHKLMFRAHVRNVIFFATLPYHLAQEMRRHGACDAGSRILADGAITSIGKPEQTQ